MPDACRRTATVVSAGPDALRLRLDPSEEEALDSTGCRACVMRGLCHGGEKEQELVLPVVAELAPGDRVEVSYRSVNPAVAAAGLFLPVILGLAAGGLAAWRLAPGRDGIFLAGCLAGLAAGAAVTFDLNRRAGARAQRTRSIRKL